MMKAQTKPFALCIDNNDYQASLIPGKVYRILPDPRAGRDDLVRIVDESGEDYLYPQQSFRVCGFPTTREEKDPCIAGCRLTMARSPRDFVTGVRIRFRTQALLVKRSL